MWLGFAATPARRAWGLKAVLDEGQSAEKESLVTIDKGRLAA